MAVWWKTCGVFFSSLLSLFLCSKCNALDTKNCIWSNQCCIIPYFGHNTIAELQCTSEKNVHNSRVFFSPKGLLGGIFVRALQDLMKPLTTYFTLCRREKTICGLQLLVQRGCYSKVTWNHSSTWGCVLQRGCACSRSNREDGSPHISHPGNSKERIHSKSYNSDLWMRITFLQRQTWPVLLLITKQSARPVYLPCLTTWVEA